ncbi:MAG: sigma-70 family RNA polymerase sigma factor [Bacteroidales bacterium]|nr:sigma-70 family RNA polymerase sigma factor [Bacteroidales bacterium]MCD8395176.1 sigma-70 family RNA polymerase sigma factor [Bacteroidales bacterium]
MQNLNKLADDKLVAAYAQGNNEAFDALLNRHKDRVYSYIFHIVKNRDLAEDIFQETFVKAITTIRQGRYTDSGKFSSWISRIAHNLIIDYYRQEKAENTVSTDNDDATDILNRRDLADENVEDHLVKRQIMGDVRRIIRALPKSQREVLVMRYYRNMSFKEIAAATGVSINTALGRMRYAILNMRRIAKENNIVLTL